MPTVSFTHLTGGYAVTFKYDADVIDTIKTVVPAWARRYIPTTKQWWVASTHVHVLAAALRAAGAEVIGFDGERPSHRETTASWASAMFAALPEHLHDPAYKALTRVLHPDIGGDPQAMQVLNDARPAGRVA